MIGRVIINGSIRECFYNLICIIGGCYMSVNNKGKDRRSEKRGSTVVVYKKGSSHRGEPGPYYKRKLRKRRIAFNVAVSVLASLMIIAGCALIVVYNYFHRINYQEIEVETSTRTSQTSYINSAAQHDSNTSDEIKTYNGTLLNDPMVLNIMLFGEDRRYNSDVGNSDTMVLFSVDTRHNKLKMLSLMRDTYVDIPGYGENRLNAAYTFGGPALTVSTIQKNYGIKIDRYAVVDFGSFKKIIDTLGGIDVELTSDEVDYINWQIWINDQDEYSDADSSSKEYIRSQLKYTWQTTVDEKDKPLNKNEITFEKKDEDSEPTAVVHLNGQQALWHARNRGEDGICGGDDFTRTERQRGVITIIINDLKKADLATLLSVIYEIGPYITTNIKTSEITSLASDLTTYLKYDIVSEAAPSINSISSSFYFSGDEHPIYINGSLSSVILIVDWDDFRQQVAEFIYEEQVARKEETSD